MPGKEVKRGWRVRWGLFCRMANWLLCIPRMYNHLQDHPLRSEVCRVRGCHPGWQTGLGEEEEDGELGCCCWMLWILFPKESEDIRMVQIKRNNMGAGLEVFSLEALFLYLQRWEASLTAVRMRRLANLWPRSRICSIGGGCVSFPLPGRVCALWWMSLALEQWSKLLHYNHRPIAFSLPFTISPLVVPEIDLSYIPQACYYFSRNHILYPSGNAAVQSALAHTHSATNRNATINGVVWTVL